MIKIGNVKTRYDAVKHRDLREMMTYSADRFADMVSFKLKKKVKKEVTYTEITFAEVKNQIECLGTAFLQRGWKGKRIAIISNNRYEWVLTYMATLCGVGICVPLDKGLPYEEVETSLIKSRADVLCFDKAHAGIIEQVKAAGTSQVKDYVAFEEVGDTVTVQQLIEEGKAALAAGEESCWDLPIDPHAMSLLLFTSGTTSQAKAVMLSHDNITSNIYSILKSLDVRPGDVSMAFLPYHHTLGSIGQLVMLAQGATTTYCDGLKYIQKNIVEYKCSVFFCVPLLVETIYKRVMKTVASQGLEKKVAFGLKLTKFLMKFGIDIRRKVFSEIHEQLGGNLRLVVSGASAIDPLALEGFNGFGFDAVQGYGMTESSPVLAFETSYEKSLGSIGKALPDIELAIDEPNEDGIGELIAKGPNVMLGYYENEEETAKTLADGWLHTGDLAYLDKDGYIFICGRKKNVIVLKNGKNVYPEELEILITNLPYVEECMVFGEPKHHDGNENDLAICAKIVYVPERMKEDYGLTDPDEINAKIKEDIDKINETLPVYKQMLRIITTDEPMIKTTTGKVKRNEEIKTIK